MQTKKLNLNDLKVGGIIIVGAGILAAASGVVVGAALGAAASAIVTWFKKDGVVGASCDTSPGCHNTAICG